MSDFFIKKTNFEIQKNKIKDFSRKLPSPVKLKHSDTDAGPFGWFDHKVTGEQFNELASAVQDNLVATNENVSNIIKEFNQIYNTFDKLDKEYIQGIIIGVKAAEKASNQAIKAASIAEINSSDIKKLVDAQKITIGKLLKFKERFDNLEYIQDLEKTFNDINKIKENLKVIQDGVGENKRLIRVKIKQQELKNSMQKKEMMLKLGVLFRNITKKNNKVNQFQDDKIKKLNIEIHEIQNVIYQKENNINEKLKEKDFEMIKQKKNIIGLVEKFLSEIDEKINAISITQEEHHNNLNRKIKDNQIFSCKKEKNINELMENQKKQLFKKIIIAYIIAGTFGMVSLSHIILNFMGML